ncbi:MAG TPA: arginase family protein [Candidatus Acidoferrales bacterium]|nr:arginase family protein [Candidatus Acidoferrales bacterium]
MAVKITRQPNLIALIGAPTSAGAHAPGHEKAPATLRAAGLVEQLNAAGFTVNDLGDVETQVFQQDDESPRARNLDGIVRELNALRPKVEEAAKSGALPLVLGGDCTIALATIAAVRRYYRHVGLMYMDRHADLNVPATTPSGRLAGMVVAHIVGRGAPELVRFWNEPPLVREPDVALFGCVDYDTYERDLLRTSPIRHYSADDILTHGVTRTAQSAIAHIHSDVRNFVLHVDADVISGEDFSASEFTGPGGLRLADVREALQLFAQQKNLLAVELTAYNPDRDTDGAAAKMLVELIVSALSARLAALTAPRAAEAVPAAAAAPEAPAPAAVPEPPAEKTPVESSSAASEAPAAASPAGESPAVAESPAVVAGAPESSATETPAPAEDAHPESDAAKLVPDDGSNPS